jgi:hypothetical protein
MRRQKTKTGPENLLAAKRKLEVIRLRRQGLTLREIGGKIGVSPARVHMILKDELSAINGECRESAEEERNLELGRLDDLHKALWKTIFEGTPEPELKIKAIIAMLKVMERRARLLGLDAPVKAAVAMAPGWEAPTPERLAEIRRTVYGVGSDPQGD